jgi:hypothetical protein
MTTFSHPDYGIELDWLAIDMNRRVALFSSGGHGPVPRIVVDRLADVERAIERLHLLPIVGRCAEWPTDGGNYESWTEPCRRGIFGFDWAPIDSPRYVRITVPSRPLMVDQFEDEPVRAAASMVRLGLDFQRTTAIQVEELDVDLFISP